jgi:DNA mismatch repair protein MSH4
MMVDVSTIHSLELVQNLQNAKSKDCLFGLMNQTLTPMGARLLRLNTRYDAVEELSNKEELFFATRAGL